MPIAKLEKHDFPKTPEQILPSKQELWDRLWEESDRGCVLCSVAMLEDFLGYLFYRHLHTLEKLNSEKRKELLKWPAPLSGFSNRISAAYIAGLIPGVVYESLHQIREIRNPFAHSYRQASFETPQVKNAVASLNALISPLYNVEKKAGEFTAKISKPQPGQEPIADEEDKTWPIERIYFVLAVIALGELILKRANKIKLPA